MNCCPPYHHCILQLLESKSSAFLPIQCFFLNFFNPSFFLQENFAEGCRGNITLGALLQRFLLLGFTYMLLQSVVHFVVVISTLTECGGNSIHQWLMSGQMRAVAEKQASRTPILIVQCYWRKPFTNQCICCVSSNLYCSHSLMCTPSLWLVDCVYATICLHKSSECKTVLK